MYPKQEPLIPILRIVFSLFLLLGLVGIGLWWLTREAEAPQAQEVEKEEKTSNCPQDYLAAQESQKRSLGEEIFLTSESNAQKEAAVAAFANCDFEEAAGKFQAFLKETPQDPESRIYFQNAQIGQETAQKIAVVVSVQQPEVMREILRGIAQAQEEHNQQEDTTPLQVEISLSGEGEDEAIATAKELVADETILAVLGYHSVTTANAVAPIYSQGELVMLAPTNKSLDLAQKSEYIFSTAPSYLQIADTIARYIDVSLDQVMVCSDTTEPGTKTLRQEFERILISLESAIIPLQCDLAASDFNAEAVISKAVDNRVYGLLLLPSEETYDRALEIVKLNQEKLKVYGLQLFGNDLFYDRATLETGQAAEEMTIVTPWYPEANEGNEFTSQAAQLWGSPVSWRTAMTYDATKAILQALANSETRTELQAALEKVDFQGATGTIKFPTSGDRQASTYLVTVELNPQGSSGTGYEFAPVVPE